MGYEASIRLIAATRLLLLGTDLLVACSPTDGPISREIGKLATPTSGIDATEHGHDGVLEPPSIKPKRAASGDLATGPGAMAVVPNGVQREVAPAGRAQLRPMAAQGMQYLPEGSANTTAYRDNGDGTVWDPALLLTWQRFHSVQDLDWAAAYKYCRQLPLAGGDWRLPTVWELQTLVDRSPPHGTQIASAFQNYESRFWTATGTPTFDSCCSAWRVGFTGGVSEPDETNQRLRVRCVRGGADACPSLPAKRSGSKQVWPNYPCDEDGHPFVGVRFSKVRKRRPK